MKRYHDIVGDGGSRILEQVAAHGPPRIVAEVPEILAPACELFNASGYVQEAVLTDYVLNVGPVGGARKMGVPIERITMGPDAPGWDPYEANLLNQLGHGGADLAGVADIS